MKTMLYEHHVALKAKIVEFHGWQMPIQYSGILDEHHTVRNCAGLFDVSHMGRIHITGPEAEPFLDWICTNRINGKADASVTYTVWCNEAGRCIDDVLVYKQDREHFFVVANSSNRQKDLQHLLSQAKAFNVTIRDCFEEAILALQGPKADAIAKQVITNLPSLKPMQVSVLVFKNQPCFVSTTGYTGSGGFEFFGPADALQSLWEQLLDKGNSHGLKPIGLGARDTLRLEKGYALYGHELSEQIAPTESVSHWTVKFNKLDFLGKQALIELENSSTKRMQCGIKLLDKGVPREGFSLFYEGAPIGILTSGTHSPSLNQGIAIGMLDRPLAIGTEIDVQIRNRFVRAQVTTLPFI